ncbi:glycosyltransferase family 4 protein, partial [bacterium]|nr:glycosyltransferase family 4 protein [bacterium]
MKILFVIYHPLGIGGAEVTTKLIAEGLKKLGHEIVFVSYGRYEGFKNYKLKNYNKIPLFYLQNYYISKYLTNVIKKEKPDIIHANDRLTIMPSIIAAKKTKTPIVIHFRDYWFVCPRSSCVAPDNTIYETCNYKTILKHYPIKRWIIDLYKISYLKSIRHILKKADIKIVNGSSVKNKLKLIGINNFETIPTLRNFKDFNIKLNKTKLKKQHKLKKTVISFIGGLTYTKGILNALKIMMPILKKNKETSFL